MSFEVKAELLKGFPIFSRAFIFVIFERFVRICNKGESANPIFIKSQNVPNGIHMFISSFFD